MPCAVRARQTARPIWGQGNSNSGWVQAYRPAEVPQQAAGGRPREAATDASSHQQPPEAMRHPTPGTCRAAAGDLPTAVADRHGTCGACGAGTIRPPWGPKWGNKPRHIPPDEHSSARVRVLSLAPGPAVSTGGRTLRVHRDEQSCAMEKLVCKGQTGVWTVRPLRGRVGRSGHHTGRGRAWTLTCDYNDLRSQPGEGGNLHDHGEWSLGSDSAARQHFRPKRR